MKSFQPTVEQIKKFHNDGYLVIPQLFNSEEITLLGKVAKTDKAIIDDAVNTPDITGQASHLTLRYTLTDDIYSAFVGCHRVAETIQALLDGPVCYFHHKMMLKEPRIGGRWEWHQDYGYWYRHEGFLYPDLVSCMIAVDPASKANGCLQVLRGSHRCGRIEHGDVAGQTGADPQRVIALQKHLETVYCEIEPGTAIFFHGNTLHASDANTSDLSRWALIGCYYRQDNDCLYPDRPGCGHEPITMIDDEQVIINARRQWQAMQNAGAATP